MFAVSFLIHKLSEKDLLSRRKTFFALCVAGIVVSFVIGPLRGVILGYLHDRRADYPDLPSTVLFSSYWLALLIYAYFEKKSYLDSPLVCYAVLVLALIAGNLLWGGYSTRFLAASFPALIIAMVSTRMALRPFVVTAFTVYAGIQWIYWT
jgi:hypothetical protein